MSSLGGVGILEFPERNLHVKENCETLNLLALLLMHLVQKAVWMSLKNKLKIENVGMFAAFIFYALVGIICFVELPISGFPPHIGIIGILSLITAYGLFEERTWSLWVVVALFFVGTTFSAYTLYYAVGKILLLDISAIAYLVFIWFFTIYVAAKRRTLES